MKAVIHILLLSLLVFANSDVITLADFPAPFRLGDRPVNRFASNVLVFAPNLTVITGDMADGSDVVGAIDLIGEFTTSSIRAEGFKPGVIPQKSSIPTVMKLASEISNLSAYNAIVIGGPCANSAAAVLLNVSGPCQETVPLNASVVKLFKHANGNYALLVNGQRALDTRIAVRAIRMGLLANMTGTTALVTGSSFSLDNIRVSEYSP